MMIINHLCFSEPKLSISSSEFELEKCLIDDGFGFTLSIFPTNVSKSPTGDAF